MASKFPSAEWLNDLHDKLNSDPKYAQIARNWEGDISLVIEPDEAYPESAVLYLDLWHGASREVAFFENTNEKTAAFSISAPFSTWLRILQGELNPVQAMATMKIRVKGSMAYIMRNVPTVLDFTRCAQETPYEL